MDWMFWKKRGGEAMLGNRIFSTRRAKKVAQVVVEQLFNETTWKVRETLYLTDRGRWVLVRNTQATECAPQAAFDWLCKYHQVNALRTHFSDRIEEA